MLIGPANPSQLKLVVVTIRLFPQQVHLLRALMSRFANQGF